MRGFFSFGIWALLLIAAIAIFPGTVFAQPETTTGLGPEALLPMVGLAGILDIRGLFTPKAIAQYLNNLPVIKTPVMDIMFANRPQIPLPVIGADVVNQVVRAMPLSQRGQGSISIPGNTGATTFYEPLPINPDTFVSAADLNNLKLLGVSDQQRWAQQKTDVIRRTIRKTTEAIAATAKSGSLSWPVQISGGVMEDYVIEFGSQLTVTPTKLFTATDAKVAHVFEILEEMKEKLEDYGYGESVGIWAGKTTYSTLLGLVGNFTSTAKLQVSVSDKGIDIGGYLIQRRTEKNYNPKTKTLVPTVADNDLEMIALDANHVMPYAAVDDLDANLQALPMFVKPIESKNPSGYQLVGQSKPFPSPNMQGIVKATVCG
ncbi:major capsid protein [uncultured Desulfuromonas sp.]|uniref:major capsid protein n=1 Tax=uncultured Desulfuromonas sp. TaxID=181013 RepID=UPI002AAAA84E|nr:major capsid protein [uncultured Desulfuromonas sp.]